MTSLWLAIIFLAVIGYYIKLQCLIVFIAIVGLYFLNNLSRKGILRVTAIVSATVLMFLTVSTGLEMTAAEYNINLDPEQKFGWQHFLMMGLNEERSGVYYDEDVAFSASFTTADERAEMDLQAAGERLEGFGLRGLLRHLSKKMLIVFNDGTFAWSFEGDFYTRLFPEPNQRLAPWLRSVFYISGSRYHIYAGIAQCLWMTVLFCTFVCTVMNKSKRNDMAVAVMQLSLLGLILYECIFEVRARYLFIYVPFFIVMAVMGIKAMRENGLKRDTSASGKG